jgi:hypothetical protein
VTSDVERIARSLAEPFKPQQLKWLPKTVKGDKALAFPYLSAADIQNRLDLAVGIANWKDDYEVLPCGAVVCTLSLCLDGAWISKQDVGSPSEQPDEHDRVKAAFSDALKRAAAKWGIGRYLRYLPPTWLSYDAGKRQIDSSKVPALPGWARPPGSGNGTVAVALSVK